MLVSRAPLVSRLLLSAMVAVGAVACDGPTPTDPLPVSISVIPSGIVPLNTGDTLTIRASVQNASRREVRFISSAPAVAGVTDAGLVQALTPGDATITVSSVDDPRATASVQVRVSPRRVSTATIQGLASSAGLPVDRMNVQGTVFVRLSVEVQNGGTVRVLIGDAVACQRVFTGAASTFTGDLQLSGAATEIQCEINTAAVDSATATPLFRNSPATLSAQVVGPDGAILYRDPGFTIRLNNPNTLVARLTAAASANDADGLRWITGPATITATPVLYDPDVGLSSVTFMYASPGGGTRTVRDTVAPFRTVFPDSFPDPAALADLVDPAIEIRATSVTTAGAPGPSGVTARERFDDAPPTPGSLTSRSWIGARTAFTDVYDPRAQADRGVGRVSVRFYAGDFTLSTADVISRGKLVSTGADLAQAALGVYRLVAMVCDGLVNCATVPGFRFGVDLTPPTADEVSLKDRTINPASDLTLRVEDDLSGFDVRPLEVITTRLHARAPAPECGPVVDGIDLPGKTAGVGGGCLPDSVGSIIPVPEATPGYYTYRITPFDRAGNRGPLIIRTILTDREPPTLTGVLLPAPVLPGDPAIFTASAADDLDLTDIVFRLVFPPGPGVPALAIPFDTASTAVGLAFDSRLTTEGARVTRFPLVRTLTSINASTRTTLLVDSLQVQAVDAARSTATSSRHLPPATYGGNTLVTDPFPVVVTTELGVDAGRVCTGTCVGDVRTRLRIDLRLSGPSALDRPPFATVYFYRRDPASGTIDLLGSMSGIEARAELSGGQATFTYTFIHTPPATLTGTYAIFAVGVSSRGGALRTDVDERRVEFFQQR